MGAVEVRGVAALIVVCATALGACDGAHHASGTRSPANTAVPRSASAAGRSAKPSQCPSARLTSTPEQVIAGVNQELQMIGTTPIPGDPPGLDSLRQRLRQDLQEAVWSKRQRDAAMKAAFDPKIGAEICLLSGH